MSFKKVYDPITKSAVFDAQNNAVYVRDDVVYHSNRALYEGLPGWALIENTPSLKIYSQGSYFVLTAYTDLNAEVDFISAMINTNGVNFGNKGGNQPTTFKKTGQTFLSEYVSAYPQNALRIFNSAFFGTGDATSQMSFPYKDNQAQHDGFTLDSNANNKNIFFQNSNGFTCQSYVDPTTNQIESGYSIANFYQDNSLAYIVGYSGSFGGVDGTGNLKRTIIGCRDDDGDGINETFVALISSGSTQVNAINKIKEFGVANNNICSLDGGGSSQLISKTQTYISSTRLIPAVIGIRN